MQQLTLNDLKGEQKKVLVLPPENPVLIKGAAGSGKTTVAIFRALHLLMTETSLFQPTTVAIFSFTNSLINYVRTLTSNKPLHVTTLHSYAGGLCRACRKADDKQISVAIQNAIEYVKSKNKSQVAILSKGKDFYEEEFAWIKGRLITSLAEYINTPRKGRGTITRVTTSDKQLLWETFEHYNNSLTQMNRCDWSDLILQALKVTEKQSFKPPFSHIVVDEAQDFTLAQLRLISKLVSPFTNSITLVADSAQRIYQSGFSWADTGMNIKGRSFEFRKNYRNTRQIATAALSLLQKETERSDFTDVELPDQMSSKPKLYIAHTSENQTTLLCSLLSGIGYNAAIAIAAPTRQNVKNILTSFFLKGIKIKSTKDPQSSSNSYLCTVDTLHSLKGVEFDHVILCDLNANLLELSSKEPDEDTLSLKRKLLYVGMTRARSSLTMISSGQPSKLLDDIDPSTIDVECVQSEII